MVAAVLDLDAARRERAQPGGVAVVAGGTRYQLPDELPIDVIDVLLSDEVGLVEILKSVVGEDENAGKNLVALLLGEGNMPKILLGAMYQVVKAIFGDEQYEAWRASRPSMNDLGKIIVHLFTVYGVGLGEAFGLLVSSGRDGQPSKPTSKPTTRKTRAASGGAKTRRAASSASAG